MKHAKGHHPGAVWRKTDFQIHTPRDPGWTGGGGLPGGSEEKELAREAWADEFVAACLKRDIGAIAITDHHDIVMYPYVARAIERSPAAKSRLWLLPGMEVTCNDSVQCLILFDQDTPTGVIDRLFGMMPKVPAPDPLAARAPQASLCGKDIEDLLGAIFQDEMLKGRNIALPHASRGGHKDILRQGFHQRFADLEVDGVYNEKPFASLDETTRKKIYGEISDWGDRRHGIITTGDNRASNYADLGINACWMRLGEATAEAVRQAVLADEARITYTEPSIPSQRVLELRVSSTLTGDNFSITFNDGFNTLIGGRGSGKSAILEYLRFALGRSTLDAADDVATNRERDMITSTLIGGFVEVDLDRNGVVETWRRTLDKQTMITVSLDGEARDLPLSVAQERFRARAFSQKQLSTMVRRPETADEQITGIAAAESVDRRRKAEQDIDEAERAIRAAFQQVVQSWAAQAAFNRAESASADLARRLESIRSRLEQGGLSAEQQAILDQQPIYNRTLASFQTAVKLVQATLDQANRLKEIPMEGWEGLVETPSVNNARQAIMRLNDRIRGAIDEITDALAMALEELARHQGEFGTDQAKFNEQYAVASLAQSHLTTLLAEFRQLGEEQQVAERNLQDAKTAMSKLVGIEVRLAEARTLLGTRLTTLREILNEASDHVIEMSTGVLRAHVEEETIPRRFVDALMELCERCGIREIEVRCRELVETAARNGRQGWEELVHRLQRIRHGQVLRGHGNEVDPTDITELKAVLTWLTDNQARLVLGRLDDDRLGKFLSAWASPFIRFDYRDRGSYMPFERASPGQQASALLTLLLHQEAGTLIIDQPEDDLDNRVIMAIAKLLQTTKRKRQLIFATHNPNFVVNGDADKVVALVPSVEPNATEAVRAAQIAIEEDGAIETPAVREAITETMEGGMRAFELRGRKYAVV
ncbi:TrlF family AAA-like ATPase [Mesorhizobium sp. WSM3882]|uniref:TrlF family AAA-like ATPase n=1 Tax=Mesorhizobium sp. WSM3882 TaxID=2029407 RepID=UPI000BAEC33D|nr:AAA family ATPase [Mesorhizobium sp. WSM3882]PBB29609.1 hypothetical protein CK214_24370 [Mesorhizobium sp. WSM3882]